MRITMLFLSLLCLTSFPLFAQISRSAETTEVKRAVAPVYPDFAMLTRIAGVVHVLVEINAEGKVVSAKGKGQEDLVLAAESAALNWRFSEFSKGKSREVSITFRFVLPSEEGEPAAIKTSFEPPYTIEIVGEKVCLTQKKSVAP